MGSWYALLKAELKSIRGRCGVDAGRGGGVWGLCSGGW